MEPMSNSAEWPHYQVGPSEHLHAVGVLSAVFNAYEDEFFDLYLHKANLRSVPYEVTSKAYFPLPEHQRLELVQTVFHACESDTRVLELIDNLVDHFNWCSKVRNNVIHAQHYPSPWFSREPRLSLIKRQSKRNPVFRYGFFSLEEVRSFADKMREGFDQCIRLLIWLKVRDIGVPKLPKGYEQFEKDPLPSILAIPAAVELTESPHMPIA